MTTECWQKGAEMEEYRASKGKGRAKGKVKEAGKNLVREQRESAVGKDKVTTVGHGKERTGVTSLKTPPRWLSRIGIIARYRDW